MYGWFVFLTISPCFSHTRGADEWAPSSVCSQKASAANGIWGLASYDLDFGSLRAKPSVEETLAEATGEEKCNASVVLCKTQLYWV